MPLLDSAEMDRFNALTQEEAKAILEACEGKKTGVRSCWYCNSGHEHLKDAVFFCFGCGRYYVRGFPAQIVLKRANGTQITQEDVDDLKDAVQG